MTKSYSDAYKAAGVDVTAGSVSYTHLDVYKRQSVSFSYAYAPIRPGSNVTPVIIAV